MNIGNPEDPEWANDNMKYIKLVFHVYQNSQDPNVFLPPGNFTNSLEDVTILRNWVEGEERSLNTTLGALCANGTQVPGHPTANATDAGYRFIFEGIENEDLFFYDDPDLWGAGHRPPCFDDISNRSADAVKRSITDNPIVQNDPNILNAMHVHLFGVSAKIDPSCPDEWNYTFGGYTSDRCVNGRTDIFGVGNYYDVQYHLNGHNPPGLNLPRDVGPPDPERVLNGSMGGIIRAESLHVFDVDHPGCNTHAFGVGTGDGDPNGDDGCLDTPKHPTNKCNDPTPNNTTTNNIMDTGLSTRCALTGCQLNRLHTFFEIVQPPYLRTPINNFEYPPVLCEKTAQPIEIDAQGSTVYDRSAFLKGDLIVKSGTELTIGCDLWMSRGTKIIVERGARLILANAHIRACDPDKRWDGIEVRGNKDVAHDPSMFNGPLVAVNPGVLIVKDFSVIEGAHTAVHSRQSGVTHEVRQAHWGGLIKAEYSTFRNNKRDVEFMKYKFKNESIFSHVNFNTDASSSLGSVTLWDTEGVTFNTCYFKANPDATDDNQFAIMTIDGSVIVKDKCRFENYFTAMAINGVFPFAVKSEIGVEGTASNEFINNRISIDVNTTNDIDIINNLFYISDISTPNKIGIRMRGYSGYKIEDNSFDEMNLAMEIRGTEFNENNIKNNTIANCNTGIRIREDNSGLLFDLNCFEDTRTDVRFYGRGSVSASVAFYQGKPGAPAFNAFKHPDEIGEMIQAADISSISEFKYFIWNDEDLNPKFIPKCDINSDCTLPYVFENRFTNDSRNGQVNTCVPIFDEQEEVAICEDLYCYEVLLKQIDYYDKLLGTLSPSEQEAVLIELQDLKRRMLSSFNHLLRKYRLDQDDVKVDILLQYDLHNDYIDRYRFRNALSKGDYSSANDFKPSLAKNGDDYQAMDLIADKYERFFQNSTDLSIPISEVKELETIALRGGTTAAMARSLLSLYDYRLWPVEEDPEETESFSTNPKNNTDLAQIIYNAVSTDLYIHQELNEPLTITLYTTDGRLMKSFKADDLRGIKSYDISDIASGLYYIQFKTKKGQVDVQMFWNE